VAGRPGGACRAIVSVELPVAVPDAWAAVVDWDGQSRWMLLTTVRATERGGVGVGGGVSARTAVGPVGFTDDMVITEWQPPHLCRVRHLGNVVQGYGEFVVAGAGAGRSRFTWSEVVVPPLGRFGRAGWPLARPVFELLMRVSLQRLVRRVAAG
jgi:hypothetical protein